jgi:hypothetical protein
MEGRPVMDTSSLSKAENEVERLARNMAKCRGRAATAGEIGRLDREVRNAYDAGRADTVAVIVDAWELYVTNEDCDDLDGFLAAVTDLMPPEWWAERERAKAGAS